MQHPEPNDRVRLTRSIPNFWLECGDVGVVRSVWDDTAGFLEVEFQKSGEWFGVRALVGTEHLDVVDHGSRPTGTREESP